MVDWGISKLAEESRDAIGGDQFVNLEKGKLLLAGAVVVGIVIK